MKAKNIICLLFDLSKINISTNFSHPETFDFQLHSIFNYLITSNDKILHFVFNHIIDFRGLNFLFFTSPFG